MTQLDPGCIERDGVLRKLGRRGEDEDRPGIDEALAEVLPGGKADEVRRLQASGETVVMDGGL